jgi:hypothetical protein
LASIVADAKASPAPSFRTEVPLGRLPPSDTEKQVVSPFLNVVVAELAVRSNTATTLTPLE